MTKKKSTANRINPKGKVFRDPIHQIIRIDPGDEFLLELIDTPVFQRLRRVRQLGVSSLIYHGAEHSRFSHSLGVYNFARLIIESLKRRYPKSDIFDQIQQCEKEVKAAALLHDIGHGPFSHMFERVLNADHEEQTIRLIKETCVANILENASVDPEAVASIFEDTYTPLFLKDIVSSQLDADRMDYLLRDSTMAGVRYGEYDAQWLLANMCLGKDPTNHDHLRLCLDATRGLHAAEQFIMARQHMSLQVYYHPVTRGFELLIYNLLKHASELAQHDQLPEHTPEILKCFLKSNKISNKDWIDFDEHMIAGAMLIWANCNDQGLEILTRLANAYLRRERFYKCQSTNERGELDDLDLHGKLSREFHDNDKQFHFGWDDGKFTPYKGVLYEAQNLKQKKIDSEKVSAQSILLSTGEIKDVATSIETQSMIMRNLDNTQKNLRRLYFRRDWLEKPEAEDKLIEFGLQEGP